MSALGPLIGRSRTHGSARSRPRCTRLHCPRVCFLCAVESRLREFVGVHLGISNRLWCWLSAKLCSNALKSTWSDLWVDTGIIDPLLKLRDLRRAGPRKRRISGTDHCNER
jgi:hypothetical protein